MQVKDLRRVAPRRWTEEIDGIRWLPRLIDKARAAIDGRLGAYLFGQSPMDHAFLRALGVSHRSFAQIVRESPDDDAVFAALVARAPDGVARAREWSRSLPRRQSVFLFLLDIDDGYAGRAYRPLKRPANATSSAITWTMKRLFPSRALEPPTHK
jgi:hypothetical protein